METVNNAVCSAVCNGSDGKQWFVLTDLKPWHAKMPGFRYLQEHGVEVFTPMTRRVVMQGGRRSVMEVPVVPSLLFAHAGPEVLGPLVEQVDTLHFRYVRGKWNVRMTVGEEEMGRFMRAVMATQKPVFLSPEDIGAQHVGATVKIIGGALDGCTGKIVTVRGSKFRRLLVEIPELLAVSVQIGPDSDILFEEQKAG